MKISNNRQSLRILLVHERFGALAGAEANLFISSLELAKRGHQVAILHGPSTGRNVGSWESLFQQRYELSVQPEAQTLACLTDFKPDVVYVHKMADLAVIEALTRNKTPLVRMVHDHDIYCMRSYKYDYFSREICTRAASPYCVFPCMACVVKNNDGGKLPVKWVSYNAKLREIALNQQFDRMFVVTTYMRDELVRNGFNPERIRISPPVPRPGIADLRSSFSDRNLIIYAGQIIRGKGVDVLIESLAKVKTKFECIILGDGNHKAYCEELTRRLGLTDCVTFKGFIPQEELTNYYKECSVVAISSLWPEPIATIGLEVMRYALPVVAFDAGGIKDWLIDGHNGCLVPWNDQDAYAAAIDKLLGDKALARQMGENGLQLVSERYDFANYIVSLETMFMEVISTTSAIAVASAQPQLLAA